MASRGLGLRRAQAGPGPMDGSGFNFEKPEQCKAEPGLYNTTGDPLTCSELAQLAFNDCTVFKGAENRIERVQYCE